MQTCGKPLRTCTFLSQPRLATEALHIFLREPIPRRQARSALGRAPPSARSLDPADRHPPRPGPAPPTDTRPALARPAPALRTDRHPPRPGPARPTHKRKLILASPRGRGPLPVRLGAAAGTGKQRAVCGSTGLPKLHGRGLVPNSSRRDQAPTAGSSALPPTAPRAEMRNQQDLARPGFFPSGPAELHPAPS